MSEPVEKNDLESFEERLKTANAKHNPDPREVVVGALSQGTKHAFELAGTTVVGGLIGFGLDRWLDTGPWLFLGFLLLGVAAGFWNLFKMVAQEAEAARQRAAKREEDQG